MHRLVTALLAVAAALLSPAARATEEWTSADPHHAWEFPRDHWSHAGYRVEWWYFTGHLASAAVPPRRFGYQFTLFRVGLVPRPPALDSAWSAANLLMGHASITDLDRGTHRFGEVLYREMPLLAGFAAWPDAPLAWSRGPLGTDEGWMLRWADAGFEFAMADRQRGMAFTLAARPLGPLVLQGPNGYSLKAATGGAASQYYSFTRLDTTGTLTLDGESFAVRGESWMDHEFSTSQLDEKQVGWDWMGLQLADGRELMLYRMRRADGGTDFARATLVAPGGGTHLLAQEEWSLQPTGKKWTSPHGGAVYPAGWRVEIPAHGIDLRVEPAVADQENVSGLVPGLNYWEGAVRVLGPTGTAVGRGYVELTGYGESKLLYLGPE